MRIKQKPKPLKNPQSEIRDPQSGSGPPLDGTAALGVLFATVVIWALRGYVWPTLSNVEVSPLQAMLDPTLFRHDFAVQESLRFSPRFYYNELILSPARLGLPLAWSFALWHAVALAALVTAVRVFAREMELGPVAAAVVLVWMLFVTAGTIGGAFFYTNAPVPGVWAGALAAWGGALAVRGRLPAAFACFGAAALLQFLVGFYAGLLAMPALVIANPRQRIQAVLAWGAGLALIYVPLVFSGQADRDTLANDAFVQIYAQLRHPHHLVPSSWPSVLWQRFVWFYLGAWFFLQRTAEGRPRLERWIVHSTVVLTGLALAANYLFVEVYPLAFFAKLQPARITPLAQGLLLALCATRIQTVAARGLWLHAAALAAAPFSLFPGLVLALAAVLTPATLRNPQLRWPTCLLVAATVVAFRPFGGSLMYHLARYGWWIAIFALLLVPHALRQRRAVLATVTLVATAGALLGLAFPGALPGFLATRFCLDVPADDGPGVLGRRFRDHSSVDALVLVPPTGEVWSFKLYAQRAVVVDDKNTPFTNAGLREWRARMDQIIGQPLTPGLDVAAGWARQSPEKLRSVANRYGAQFVLTRDAWHATLPGRRIDTEQGWSLWELPR